MPEVVPDLCGQIISILLFSPLIFNFFFEIRKVRVAQCHLQSTENSAVK